MSCYYRLSVILSLLTVPLFEVSAQWTLTPDGFQAEGEYLVLEAEGSQAELYQRVKDHLFKTYTSPDNVVSENEPTSIRVAGEQSQVIYRNSMHTFDLKYSIFLEFKDGRIRMSAPSFELTTISAGKFQTLHLVYGFDMTGRDLGIYSESGKLKSKRAKDELEKFFNGWTELLKQALQSRDSW